MTDETQLDLEAACVDKGMRMTEQRRIIARVLQAADDHPDVEELYRRASAVDPNISISTVYRTVKLFEDAGIIERHEFRDGRARYETLPEEHHDHLIDLAVRQGDRVPQRGDRAHPGTDRPQARVSACRPPAGALRRAARQGALIRAVQMLAQIRFVGTVALAALALAVLLPFHLLAMAASGRSSMKVAQLWQRFACFLIGIRVTVTGAPVGDRPLLLLSNHNSWIDIPVLASVAPVSFVAKSEVAGWPVVSFLAKAQRTVFVERNNRRATGAQADEMAGRLSKGDIIVLFAEGTSSDGNKVLPFRSALVGAAQRAIGTARRGAGRRRCSRSPSPTAACWACRSAASTDLWLHGMAGRICCRT